MKILIILLLSVNFTFAQDTIPCSCCTEEYQQFDFWIGDWNVYDTAGILIGTNLITSVQDNCGLQENWASTAMTGTSYNYYNKKNGSWNQVWVDNKEGSLVLKGDFKDGSMVMKSELAQA